MAGGNGLDQMLAALCREWLRAQEEDFQLPDPRVALHDPLTAAVIVRPDLCQWAERSVTVDKRGHATAVVPDVSSGETEGTMVQVAVDVDPPAARAELLDVLGV